MPTYSDKPITTNKQLLRLSEQLRLPLEAILFKDQFAAIEPPAAKPRSRYFYIINLGDVELGGTHWTGLFLAGREGAFYFDSFGAPPPRAVADFMWQYVAPLGGGHAYYSDGVIQNIHSGYCGQYVILFGRYMSELLSHPAADRFTAFLSIFNEQMRL